MNTKTSKNKQRNKKNRDKKSYSIVQSSGVVLSDLKGFFNWKKNYQKLVMSHKCSEIKTQSNFQ